MGLEAEKKEKNRLELAWQRRMIKCLKKTKLFLERELELELELVLAISQKVDDLIEFTRVVL